MHFFTSITTCYLPKARVLAATLKKHNPNATMHLVIADELPAGFNLKDEDFDYVWNAEEFINTENNKQWFYIHTVVELCTAIKGAAAIHILKETKADKIVYLDPDIGVFGDLSSLSDMLDENSVLFTPHQIEPVTSKKDIIDDEICSLKHGVYNFGFFAIKNDENGLKFLTWWNDRLMDFCYDDIPNGLFTDQKWGDIAPALFGFIKIIHEPEYNVATWNLSTRTVTGDEFDGWKVNGKPLKFYHFTGFDSGDHRKVLAQHAKEGDPVWNLSLLYEKMMYEKGQEKLGKTVYKYAYYDNGKPIRKSERIVFRKRMDLQTTFENPFGEKCYSWMKANVGDTDQYKDIAKLCYKRLMYKLLYKVCLFGIRKKLKAKHRYYNRLIEDIQTSLS